MPPCAETSAKKHTLLIYTPLIKHLDKRLHSSYTNRRYAHTFFTANSEIFLLDMAATIMFCISSK